MKVINIQGHDGINVGDYASSPANYFTFPFNVEKANIASLKGQSLSTLNAFRDEALIIGGGGLLIFGNHLEYLANSRRNGILVTWGIGHNTHRSTKIDSYPYYLEKFDLNGIRDFSSKYRWVPCVSCMSHKFDEKVEPNHEIIVYEHKDFPLEIEGFPKQNNQSQDFESRLNFLASGSTILTNSYHGAYWGLLFGRRVLVINPFSSKFVGLHPKLIVTDIDSWKSKLSQAVPIPDFLGYCREANRSYFELATDIIMNPPSQRRLFAVTRQNNLAINLRRRAYRIKRTIQRRLQT